MSASGLRILLPIKRVIDYAIKPRVNKELTGVHRDGVKMSMNPFDELAVTFAAALRDQKKAAVEGICAVSIGPAKAQDQLRTALAMGADKAIHVDDTACGDAELQPLAIAKILQKVVEKEGSNMVVLGKQAIDGDNGQTGQILAGLLGWSQATQAASVTLDEAGKTATVTREVDGGTETIKANLPVVITTDLRLCEPKLPTLRAIMKAKSVKIAKMDVGEMGVETASRVKVLKVAEPAPRKAGVKVEDVDGLVAKLKELGAL